MSFVAVLPWVYKPYRDACVQTMHSEFYQDVLEVDNSQENQGIMRSHNLGVEFMREMNADWLIVISAAIRFGRNGGMDFLDVLEANPDHYVIHAASENVKGGKQQTGEDGGRNEVFGLHLTAFHRTVFDNIGTWDENFSNYGLDDIDLSLRLQKYYKGAKNANGTPLWNTYPCDVGDTTMSHSINLAHITGCAYPPRNAYFMRKWGRDGGQWESMGYEHPFDDESKDLGYWPDRDDPLSIHNVEFAPTSNWKFED